MVGMGTLFAILYVMVAGSIEHVGQAFLYSLAAIVRLTGVPAMAPLTKLLQGMEEFFNTLALRHHLALCLARQPQFMGAFGRLLSIRDDSTHPKDRMHFQKARRRCFKSDGVCRNPHMSHLT
jgi:hypothetical protein